MLLVGVAAKEGKKLVDSVAIAISIALRGFLAVSVAKFLHLCLPLRDSLALI